MKRRKALECGGQRSATALLDESHAEPRRRRRRARPAHAKTLRLWPAGFCLLTCVLCLSARAQSYSIDWHTIDGGGGTSTGGVYSVSGTIGQPDAGPTISGGNYSVNGGFWSLVSFVQTPGAPLLSLSLTATNTAIISWPFPSTGFALEENPSLGTSNWMSVTNSVQNDSSFNWVVVPATTGSKLFRLKK